MGNPEPTRLYAFTEAAGFIPSVRGGTISPHTLWRWYKSGLFSVEVRRIGHRRDTPFIRGSELLRLLRTETVTAPAAPAPRPRSKAEADADYRRAVEYLQGHGIMTEAAP